MPSSTQEKYQMNTKNVQPLKMQTRKFQQRLVVDVMEVNLKYKLK
jgi:hypothetical protein